MTREEIRVGCYDRALTLHAALTRPLPVPEIARQFAEFAGDDGWKLQALDLAMRVTNRRASLEHCLEEAATVALFVVPAEKPPVVMPDDGVWPKPKARSKSKTRKR